MHLYPSHRRTICTVLLILMVSFSIIVSAGIGSADSTASPASTTSSCELSTDWAALNVTGPDSPSGIYPGGYWYGFPDGSASYVITFDSSYIPEGMALDPAWAGSGAFEYEAQDLNTTGDAFHSAGDRITEYHDFSYGDVPNSSGDIYRVYGRGQFSFNGSGSVPHQWQVTYDFSGLVGGRLPAGTLLGFTDIDGSAVAGESVVLTSSATDKWMVYCDDAQNGGAHGQASYTAGSYTFDGPNSGNDAIAYLTTEDLTSITMNIAQGTGGSSLGVKLAAPLVNDCSVSTDLAALNLTDPATFVPGPSTDYGFTFDNDYIPASWMIDPAWAGVGTIAYSQQDGNATADAFHVFGDRVTEYHDFNPGDVPNTSGRVYSVHGRGTFAFNGSGTLPHEWQVTYSFANLANGYLPTGTLLGFTDIDGLAAAGESVVLTSDAGSAWLSYCDDAQNGALHGQAAYDAGSNSYTFDGPNSGNDAIAYVTTENVASITMTITQGTGDSSLGLKLAAPIVHGLLYVSSTSGGNAGGVGFADEDVLSTDLVDGVWAKVLDGSDVGLSGSGARDVDALHQLSDGTVLLSFQGSTTIPDVGAVDDSDIVRFVPTTLGSDSAGTFELYFDGSDVGLTANGEDVDALFVAQDGSLLISTSGSFSVDGVTAKDEDILRFSPTVLGTNTAGSWSLEFDGSDVGLNDASSEDVSGVWVDEATGDIYLTVRGAFTVAGVTGDAADVFVCAPASVGSNTSCTFTVYWDGSANGYSDEKADAIHVAR